MTWPRSISSRAVKVLLALAVSFVGFVVAPTAASAAPAHNETVVSQQTTGNLNSVDSPVSVNAVFTCNWFSRTPFQIVDFVCQVTSGTMRVYIICLNGQRINSAPITGPGTFNIRLTCPGVRVQTIGWESLT
jgi:hypothetical protein